MKFRLILLTLISTVIILTIAGSANADVLGVDVSKYQGIVDWNAVSSQFGFAMIKAGGSDNGFYTDPQFARNRDAVRALGIPHGFYYYAGGGDPAQEAEHFASIVGPLQPGEVVAMDYEVDHPYPIGYSLSFMNHTQELLGAKPIFYTYMNKVWGSDWQQVAANGNPLWGAIYDDNPTKYPASGAWPGVTMKQFTSSGQVAGINGDVDVNFYGGSKESFEAMGKPAPPPPPAPLPATGTTVPAGALAGRDGQPAIDGQATAAIDGQATASIDGQPSDNNGDTSGGSSTDKATADSSSDNATADGNSVNATVDGSANSHLNADNSDANTGNANTNTGSADANAGNSDASAGSANANTGNANANGATGADNSGGAASGGSGAALDNHASDTAAGSSGSGARNTTGKSSDTPTSGNPVKEPAMVNQPKTAQHTDDGLSPLGIATYAIRFAGGALF